jgi:hypothetical protein
MSNNSYDFRMIVEKVNASSLKGMFTIDSPFKLNAPRQSSLYLANLRQVCELMKYDSFHKELMEFVDHESISSLVDKDAVENIHTELEIKHFQRVYRETIESEAEDEAEAVEHLELELESEADGEAPQNQIEDVSLDRVSCLLETTPLKTPVLKKSVMSLATAYSDMSPQFSPESLIDSSPL